MVFILLYRDFADINDEEDDNNVLFDSEPLLEKIKRDRIASMLWINDENWQTNVHT